MRPAKILLQFPRCTGWAGIPNLRCKQEHLSVLFRTTQLFQELCPTNYQQISPKSPTNSQQYPKEF